MTLLADDGEAPDAADGEVAPPARPAPAIDPEPTLRARPIAKPPAPAPRLPAESPPATTPVGPETGTAFDANHPSAAESGSAATSGDESAEGALPGPTSGSAPAGPYGEHDVDRAAGPIGGIRRPSYPARERMLGREGRVSLLVNVDPTGTIRGVEVTESAGEAFDAAARRAVEATPFRPAERRGSAVASTVTVNVSFELD